MNSQLTDYLVNKSNGLLEVKPEVSDPTLRYYMFNGGSTEVEVAEFLHGLVKLVKPQRILETGTHAGVSATYMAQALKENGFGKIETVEYEDHWVQEARKLIDSCELQDYCEVVSGSSLDYLPGDLYEIIFLDTEPQIRFDELVKFYPSLREGGFMMIHDLHPHLGHTDETVNGIYDWPYGDFRPKFAEYLKNHDLVTVNFRSPRGFTLFYKPNKHEDAAYKLIKGEI